MPFTVSIVEDQEQLRTTLVRVLNRAEGFDPSRTCKENTYCWESFDGLNRLEVPSKEYGAYATQIFASCS